MSRCAHCKKKINIVESHTAHLICKGSICDICNNLEQCERWKRIKQTEKIIPCSKNKE